MHSGDMPPPLANLLMCLLFEPDFKGQLTPLFIDAYGSILQGVLGPDGDLGKDVRTIFRGIIMLCDLMTGADTDGGCERAAVQQYRRV